MGETGFSAYEDERQSLVTRGLPDLDDFETCFNGGRNASDEKLASTLRL